ncbi:hypothetical protein GCM10023195_53840 [Actinoallomurus liliacearum]|uniref:Uncharacterized protein n=1 Tax=Actinoallomurus liliacearum TaxID=1080073 RepID=A0ABP8TS56_9ACTN
MSESPQKSKAERFADRMEDDPGMMRSASADAGNATATPRPPTAAAAARGTTRDRVLPRAAPCFP